MEYKDYYKILGVSKDASTDDIKKAYRKLVKKYHPDSGESGEKSKEKFQEVSEAYEVLKDAEKRKKYDAFGASGNFSSGSQFDPSQYGYKVNYSGNASDFSDFFDMIFGKNGFDFSNFAGTSGTYTTGRRTAGNPFTGSFRRQAQPQYQQMSSAEVKISVYEAYHGTERMMSLDDGSGQLKQLKVKIPAGIKSGEKLRMKNAGVELKIVVEDDAVYKLKDGVLTQNINITPYDAVLGGKVSFATIDGSVINLNIKPGTQAGKKLKIPNKGFKDRKGNVGDLIVNIVIVIPDNPGEKEITLYKELQKIHQI